MVHYHIRWSDLKFDWQAFTDLEDARQEAERLVLPGETYTIDSFEEDCPQCQTAGLFQK